MAQSTHSDEQRDPTSLLGPSMAGEGSADAASLALRLRIAPARTQQPDAVALIRELRDEERM